MTSDTVSIHVYAHCRSGRCDDCLVAVKMAGLAPKCEHECHGGSWEVCRRCRKEYALYGDGYDGMCPECADATEPWTPERLGFADPDDVGASEYRAIYDCIADALVNVEEEVADEPPVFVAAMLDEFILHARTLRRTVETGDEAAYRRRAKRQYHREGEVEVDDDAQISVHRADEQGAYVSAWVWVDKEDL